ncbi:coiled-coil domain-containing protein 117 isoform X2 [Synchiropus splendidus]|uniref:coiled-coil domain-containing protein 117 isoform X2 n=1 Tax=Synchiropus splendidus TaxID=270530 RepID=UPI00237EA25B|nr:coiled-coil domain-containing protein 117 isoform X2 [Synchiropus splendidus]
MEWTAVHHARAPTHELGLCAFPGHTSLAELDPGPAPGPAPAAQHPQPASLSGSSWEARCLRKHRRRRSADEGCLAKRRRLAAETQAPTGSHSHSHPGLCGARPQAGGPRAEPSCLEMEAAQRKLREIESRITLEDDDEDPDLEVEPAPRRPVLVLSDSLKEGLQRGMGDILPHTVAQSVYVLPLPVPLSPSHRVGQNPAGFTPRRTGVPQLKTRLSLPCGAQESLLYGAGVVAAARGPLLSQAQGLPAQTAETADGCSAEPRPASTPHPGGARGAPLWRGGHGDGAVSSRSSPHLLLR